MDECVLCVGFCPLFDDVGAIVDHKSSSHEEISKKYHIASLKCIWRRIDVNMYDGSDHRNEYIYILRDPNDNCCSYHRFYGVVVSTANSESADPGSNPGRTLLSYYITMFFLIYPQCSSSFILSRQLA